MKRILLLSLFFSGLPGLYAQDLLKELEASEKPQRDYVNQTFKGTRVINGFSVETKGKGELEFIFAHRFGTLNEGSYTLWGLDNSFVRLGLEYGLTDRLGIGLGRTSTDKTIDSYLRYKLFRQNNGDRSFPFTATATWALTYDAPNFAGEGLTAQDRLAFASQVAIARKINSSLSVQVTPMFVHRNAVIDSIANNDDFALGFAARQKITRSVSLSAEYILRLNAPANSPYYNAIGLGIDIETGGHVFQLVFTNTRGMFDRWVVAETTGDFFDGDVHFGFNVTRVFQIGKTKR
jgi:hypothetical protein